MNVLRRNLNAHTLPAGPEAEWSVLLECLDSGLRSSGRRVCDLFFHGGAGEAAELACPGTRLLATRTIAGSTLARVALPKGSGSLQTGAGQEIPVREPETSLFEGLNCAVSERNGEPVSAVAEWLTWHAKHHGLEAALILDRGRPAAADDFAAEVEEALAGTALSGTFLVVVLSADVPLGKPGLGAEAHPMNAPDAPGKDRMEDPAPDPWSAPLAAGCLHELLRHRFLAKARAVMNIDVHDILPPGDGSVFDAAVSAGQGVIALEGERVYPWAVRKGRQAHFADHICSRFDGTKRHPRWVVAPAAAPAKCVWRYVRVAGAEAAPGVRRFFRCMALRHGGIGGVSGKVSQIVPKSSLVENSALLDLASALGGKPVRMPEEKARRAGKGQGRVAIVTTMKNEGPFILEWLAYHRAIGVKDFLVYTNDCDDGTDSMLALLQEKGIVQHRDNPFRKTGLKPQHAALAASEKEELIRKAGWLICMDVDEFITVHTGDGTLPALFEAVPDANMISLTWRLFGNSDVAEFRDEFITERFTRCAPLMTRKPHQAWGFKTLFRNLGLFKKLGVHRPKGLKPQLLDQISWVNGSGASMPKDEYRNAWRSTVRTVGYDLVTLNHYAVRSAESFLVKRDRGRVNHVDRDQGLAYWFRMNNNAEEDRSIQRMLPALRREFDRLMSDPDIAAAHEYSVARHRTRIGELKSAPKYRAFYAELTGSRLQKLSRLHRHFGSAVFLAGPECIPEGFQDRSLQPEDQFTVPKTKTQH
jgi:hypothetical protein